MSMLLFAVGDNRYVIENRYVLRLIPSIPLKKIPYASTYVAGLLNFNGKPVPIVDFCKLIEQRVARHAFDSRIIILMDIASSKDNPPLLGLIGEKVTDIYPFTPNQFSETGFYLRQFPYLDGVYSDQKGVIQQILVPELFTYLSGEFFNLPSV